MEWISVKDRLPEKENDYLTYVIDNGCSYRQEIQHFYEKPRVLKGIYKDCFSHWELTKWDDDIVTHWMPLPNPPQKEHANLKACPFCNYGNAEENCEWLQLRQKGEDWFILCLNCGARGPACASPSILYDQKAKKIVIKQWNREYGPIKQPQHIFAE